MWSVVTWGCVLCIIFLLMLHHQEVLMHVCLEFQNPRFHLCLLLLVHWPWACNYISLGIPFLTCKAGIIIMIFTMKCLGLANAAGIWQWCVVLMEPAKIHHPPQLIKGSVWVTLQQAEHRLSGSWTLGRDIPLPHVSNGGRCRRAISWMCHGLGHQTHGKTQWDTIVVQRRKSTQLEVDSPIQAQHVMWNPVHTLGEYHMPVGYSMCSFLPLFSSPS